MSLGTIVVTRGWYMAEPELLLDPWAVGSLAEGRCDPSRTIGLLHPSPEEIAAAACALANTRGGDLLLGVRLDGEGAVAELSPGSADSLEAHLTEALTLLDPPIGHLVRTRAVPQAGGWVVVARVRMSPSTPHLVTVSGHMPRLDAEGVRPVRSRREVDDLYARGRGERERADRLVDAMIEKLTLAHYAFYNIAIVACTHEPTAEPFSAAAGGALAPEGDRFVAAFDLAGQEPRVGPGEIEVRTPGETGGYLRVTRGGCVAAGEIQRRPYHEELDTLEGLNGRFLALSESVCRMLGQTPDAVMVPHLFVEGVRGLRLLLDAGKRTSTGHAPQDTVRYALSLGDPCDPEYPARVAAEAVARLQSLFPPTR